MRNLTSPSKKGFFVTNIIQQQKRAQDKHTQRSFTVVAPLDLNVNPLLRQPYGVSESKILCCGPCQSAPITAQFSVPRVGFVPGEAIPFRVELNNVSSREIKQISVHLVQHVRFRAPQRISSKRRIAGSQVFSGKF
jgi:hypothetical protein